MNFIMIIRKCQSNQKGKNWIMMFLKLANFSDRWFLNWQYLEDVLWFTFLFWMKVEVVLLLKKCILL